MPEELDSIGSSCKNDQEDHNSQQNVFQSFKKRKKTKKKKNKTKQKQILVKSAQTQKKKKVKPTKRGFRLESWKLEHVN